MKLFALAVLVVFLAVPTASASTPTLTGAVGPSFTISLKEGAKKVATLKAGTYVIKVSDKAVDHNFHLSGPGVNKKTSVTAKTSTTWKVTLKKGKYTYDCDP